jgi:hypothetical protein
MLKIYQLCMAAGAAWQFRDDKRSSRPRKIIELLLDHGANIDTIQAPYNITPLMRAVSDNKVSLLKLLLERGANPLFRNNRGETALEIAQKLLQDQLEEGFPEETVDIQDLRAVIKLLEDAEKAKL